MTDRVSAEGLLRGNPRNREHREETNEGRRFWRCVPLADAIQAAHDAALRDTGPRPDSDAVLLANAILGGSSYLPHREAAERILARDTGPRPDSGMMETEDDWEYTCPPECSDTAAHLARAHQRLVLSTPRTETSEP